MKLNRELIALKWMIEQNSTGEVFNFNFILYVNDEVRALIDWDWSIDKEKLIEYWFSDEFSLSWFNLEVDKIIGLSAEIHSVH